jgi:hypothetical protein
MNTQDTIELLKSKGFILVGSRSVFNNEDLPLETDFDFMQIDSGENRLFLEASDFVKCIEVGGESIYFEAEKDTCSTSIWKSEEHDIQVVLKLPQKFEDLKKFWRLMQKNPEAFRTKFWKSYEVAPEIVSADNPNEMIKPNTKENIALEMAYFLTHIIPHVEV